MDGLFVKRAPQAGVDLRGEGAALTWLGEAEAQGGLHAARVRESTADLLSEERVRTAAPSADAARRIGEKLARTHAAGAAWLGCPPPDAPAGFAGYVIDGALTPVVSREETSASWGEYYARWRIEPHVRTLRDEGDFGASEVRLFGRLCERLSAGEFDVPQPALVEERIVATAGDAQLVLAEGRIFANAGDAQPVLAEGRTAATAGDVRPVTCARLHGDLWAGNLLWSADRAQAGALIDPMAHGGHAETDLAMLQLFGYPYLDEVLRAYDEASPLADGWRERVGLHQLNPLLLHCVLFGGGYVGQTLSVARRYV